MFCGKCGNKIDDKDKFCIGCGNKLDNREDISYLSDRTNLPTQKNNLNIFIMVGGILAISIIFLFVSSPEKLDSIEYGKKLDQVIKEFELKEDNISTKHSYMNSEDYVMKDFFIDCENMFEELGKTLKEFVPKSDSIRYNHDLFIDSVEDLEDKLNDVNDDLKSNDIEYITQDRLTYYGDMWYCVDVVIDTMDLLENSVYDELNY